MILATDAPPAFDLAAYARKHRYRLRNLHDGHPVPPAIYKGPKGQAGGYTGEDDRWDAIVGYDGYVTMDGNRLSVCLFYKSARGVKRARGRLEAMGGRVEQEGDDEISGTVPVEQIEEALKLIRVSKIKLTNPEGNPASLAKGSVTGAATAPESPGLDPLGREAVRDAVGAG